MTVLLLKLKGVYVIMSDIDTAVQEHSTGSGSDFLHILEWTKAVLFTKRNPYKPFHPLTPKGIPFMRVKRIEDECMSKPVINRFYDIFLQELLVKLLV